MTMKLFTYRFSLLDPFSAEPWGKKITKLLLTNLYFIIFILPSLSKNSSKITKLFPWLTNLDKLKYFHKNCKSLLVG